MTEKRDLSESNFMRWLGRGFWISSLGVWTWLGVGLGRELPRRVGQPLSSLPVAQASILGFVGDTDFVAVRRPVEQEAASHFDQVEVYDARSGLLHHTLTVHADPELEVRDRLSIRWGALIRGVAKAKAVSADDQGFTVTDIVSGTRRKFSDQSVVSFAIHPDKPWVALTQFGTPESPSHLAVKDLRTGESIFERELAIVGDSTAALVFIPDRNAIAVRVDASKAKRIEVYPLALGTAGESAGVDLDLFADLSASRKGRVCLHQPHGWSRPFPPDWNDVYDLLEKRYLSSIPPTERGNARATAPMGAFRTVISPSGRALLRGKPGALYRVGDAAIVWQPKSHERIMGSDKDANRPLPWDDGFDVTENWQTVWKAWFPNLHFETVARRSLESGELMFRTPKNVFVEPSNCNAVRTLFLNGDGLVYALPLGFDWTLLAICQLILFLPILVPWFVLRRRGRFSRATATTAGSGTALNAS